MSEQKKYLGKKRQKIFIIEKNYIQQTPKNISRKKVCPYNIEPLISSEEIPIEKTKKIILNLDESNDKISTETQKHSLIGISKLVFEYLKKTVNTTGNEVTENIKNMLQSKKNDQLNQKNIQRRVYDAINVMCAVGLIKKNKQKIQFLLKKNQGSNLDNANNKINSKQNKEDIDEENMDNEIILKKKNNELEEKRNILVKDYISLKFYEKYQLLNEKYPERKMENKLEFPFDIIKYDNSSPIKITSKDDESRYLLLSNSEFVHHNPYDIIKKLISSDILLKISENANNINDCKSNSKKSTNDNSLVEEFNYNINNNVGYNIELEEKKCQETPRKNKIYSGFNSRLNYIIQKGKSSKKSKEEKEDDIVFEYLKNKKCFIDELLSTNVPQVEANNGENKEIDKNIEDPENNFEKESENIFFTGKRFRKNSNCSFCSNFYDESMINRNKCDLISENEMFI